MSNGLSTMETKHVFRFSLRDVLVIFAIIVPLLGFLASSYYSNERFHAMQAIVNEHMEGRLVLVEKHYEEMLAQHSRIMNRLDKIREIQKEILLKKR